MDEKKDRNQSGEHEENGNDKEEYHFLREVIKKKPLDKRQIALRVGGIIGGAIVFGMVAAFVFCKTLAYLEPEEKERINFHETGEDTEKNISDAEKKEELPANTPEPTQAPVKEQDEEMNLEDFESAYEEILKVATEPERSIVTVQGITSDVDWMNNSYEDSNQVSGILAADNGKEYFVLTEYRAVDQVDIVAAALVVDLLHPLVVEAVDLVGSAEGCVDGVRVSDQLSGFLPGHIFHNISPHLLGQGELAVRKCAGARPAAHDIAGLAVDAAAGFSGRTVPPVDGESLVHQ